MTELEQLKTKIHHMEESWCSFIENYNRDFAPQSKLLIADMTKRMETYCFPRDKEVDTVYCSWQTSGDFKMLAAVSIRKEDCHYDFRFWAEVMKEARRGNHTMVEWCESRYEFEEWLCTPSAAIQLEEGLKRLYCNFFKDILNYRDRRITNRNRMYHRLSQYLLECSSSETKESAGGLFLFLLAIEGTYFLNSISSDNN